MPTINQVVSHLEVLVKEKKLKNSLFPAAISIALGHVSDYTDLINRFGCSIRSAKRWLQELRDLDLIQTQNDSVANLAQCMIIDLLAEKNITNKQSSEHSYSNFKESNLRDHTYLVQRARKINEIASKVAELLKLTKDEVARILGRRLPRDNEKIDESQILYVATYCRNEYDHPEKRPVNPSTGEPDAIRNLGGYFDRALQNIFAENKVIIHMQSHKIQQRKIAKNQVKVSDQQTSTNMEYEECKSNILNFKKEQSWKRAFNSLFKSAEKRLDTWSCLGLAENLYETITGGSFVLDQQEYEVDYNYLAEAIGYCGSRYKPWERYVYQRYTTLMENKNKSKSFQPNNPKQEPPKDEFEKDTKLGQNYLGIDFSVFREN